jgi:hypothetical protein
MVTLTKTWIAVHVGKSLRRASQRRRSKRCTDRRQFQLRSDVQRAALPSEYRSSFRSLFPFGLMSLRLLPRAQNHIPIIVSNLVPIWRILSMPLARSAE